MAGRPQEIPDADSDHRGKLSSAFQTARPLVADFHNLLTTTGNLRKFRYLRPPARGLALFLQIGDAAIRRPGKRTARTDLSESSLDLTGFCPGVGHGCQNHLEQYQWFVSGSNPAPPINHIKGLSKIRGRKGDLNSSVLALAQLSENARYVPHAPMLDNPVVSNQKNITGGEAEGSMGWGNPEVGSAMRAGVDEARRPPIVGDHCRFNGYLKIWYANKSCRKEINCALFRRLARRRRGSGRTDLMIDVIFCKECCKGSNVVRAQSRGKAFVLCVGSFHRNMFFLFAGFASGRMAPKIRVCREQALFCRQMLAHEIIFVPNQAHHNYVKHGQHD